MTRLVYTMGYSGHRATGVTESAVLLDATVFDIRWLARSGVLEFNKGNLVRYLGNRYYHCRNLGNENYRGDLGEGIVIHDLKAGLREILVHERPVILMCACREFEECHRSAVSRALAEIGIITREIKPCDSSLRKELQLTLFGL